ncbi:MAG: hypothetical protein ACKO8I_01575 [Cyanobacteriota bacterium]
MSPDPLTVAAAEQARSVRNDFAHSAADPSLAEPHHQKRLQRVYPEAESTPLWLALAPLLARQAELSAEERSFILLVTILVASIEACALLQVPFAPRATVRFPAITI